MDLMREGLEDDDDEAWMLADRYSLGVCDGRPVSLPGR
jgi:hypothetical protein